IRDGHVTGVQTCALPIFALQPLHPPDDLRPERSGRGGGSANPASQWVEARRRGELQQIVEPGFQPFRSLAQLGCIIARAATHAGLVFHKQQRGPERFDGGIEGMLADVGSLAEENRYAAGAYDVAPQYAERLLPEG